MVWKGLTVADGAGPFLAPTPWLPIRVACDVRSIETSWKPRRTPGRSRMCCEAIEDVGVHAAAAVHRCCSWQVIRLRLPPLSSSHGPQNQRVMGIASRNMAAIVALDAENEDGVVGRNERKQKTMFQFTITTL
uniref:Predicted protein n=1 Tax=Physcomitrium patens TaxID=3218 RepID=A9U6H6_PHYPA